MKLAMMRRFLFGLLLLATAAAQGSVESSVAPDKLVREVTDTLLADIATYRDALDGVEDQARRDALLRDFYDSLTATLEPVVDFNWIALNVMGDYRKQATAEQRQRFREVFARGLVETYGRGLLTYSDQEIVVHPLTDGEQEQRRVVVKQEIRGKDQSYPLQYSMGLTRDGQWKVINVIINGINLGQTFRNQFVQAANSHNGDLDKVIANWTATAAAAASES